MKNPPKRAPAPPKPAAAKPAAPRPAAAAAAPPSSAANAPHDPDMPTLCEDGTGEMQPNRLGNPDGDMNNAVVRWR